MSSSLGPGALGARLAEWRRGPFLEENGLLIVLGAAALGVVLAVAEWPDMTPFSALMVPLLLGSMFLGPRQLPWFVIWVLTMLCASVALQVAVTPRIVGGVAVMFLMGFIVLLTSFRRSRLGVGGLRGESMLVDLRDRLLNQAGIPQLPDGWVVETALRSAGGTPFAGDFLVAELIDEHRLEVVVVDVSGKGEQAGTRALQLSGAFGGLLGALPPERFLPAANEYLLRQGWEEGFATAVHLSLDLRTGDYQVRSAGHPPAAHRLAGSGRWVALDAGGPVLGLIDAAPYDATTGRFSVGDSVLLYTDGMVELPHRDIDLGLDKLMGEAERVFRDRRSGWAEALVDQLGSKHDDRALVLVHRARPL